MENRYNTVVIHREKYRTEDEYFQAIGAMIDMLQKNDYTVVIPRRECNFTMLDFNYADPQMGSPLPVWLTPEEEEQITEYDSYYGGNR